MVDFSRSLRYRVSSDNVEITLYFVFFQTCTSLLLVLLVLRDQTDGAYGDDGIERLIGFPLTLQCYGRYCGLWLGQVHKTI
jgi:hypothetical protein